MKFEDLKFMSIGGYCLSLFALGPDRLKGPVDNILMLNSVILEKLLNKRYYNYLKTTPYIKKGPKKYFFKDLQIRHNDFEDQKYLKEVYRRLETFYTFIKDITENENKFLIFSIPHSFFGLNLQNELINCINILKKHNFKAHKIGNNPVNKMQFYM